MPQDTKQRPVSLGYCSADKGTGAFQYFLKLVPTMHSLGSQSRTEAEGAEQPTSLTSQFTYTFKFRSLKGATEYHTEHEEGEGKGKQDGSRRAAALNAMLLPGSCNNKNDPPPPRHCRWSMRFRMVRTCGVDIPREMYIEMYIFVTFVSVSSLCDAMSNASRRFLGYQLA